jgi:hypothetical protein
LLVFSTLAGLVSTTWLYWRRYGDAGVDVPAAMAAALVAVATPTLAHLRGRHRGDARIKGRDQAVRQRVDERRRFAGIVESRLRAFSPAGEWATAWYVELETETERQHRILCRLACGQLLGGGPRREPSLTRALLRSTEQLIVLEGEPDAGAPAARSAPDFGYVTTDSAARSSPDRISPT